MPASRKRRVNPDVFAGMVRDAVPIPPVTEADNERLLAILNELDQLDRPTPEQSAFAQLLTIVIQDFESRHYPMPTAEPHEILRAAMEDRGMQHKDLAAIVGNKGLTTEILAGRRKISKTVAKHLSSELSIPIEMLI